MMYLCLNQSLSICNELNKYFMHKFHPYCLLPVVSNS